jgi:hypothetical protein
MRSKKLWVLACLAATLYVTNNSCVNAQFGGMGGMGGTGHRKTSTANDEPEQAPTAPPTKANPFAPDATPVEGAKERMDVMEKFTFGHAQSGQKLDKRVERLEKRLVPYEHHKGIENLHDRVDRLWSIMATANGAGKSDRSDKPEKPDKDDKK